MEEPNPAYDTWIQRDQQVLGYLLGPLSTELLVQAASLEHVVDLWGFINTTFAPMCKVKITHLWGALSSTNKLNN